MIERIIVVGLGKMGVAISRILCRDLEVHGLEISEKAISKIPNFLRNKIIFEDTDSVLNLNLPTIIAIKPSQVKEFVSQIRDDRLIISIAAGVTTDQIEGWRKKRGGVARVMPNMPFRIGMGISCLMTNSHVSPELTQEVSDLFSRGGDVITLEKEDDFHAVTALSGSGPAFVFNFIQVMEDTGVELGLTREIARKLAIRTVIGSSTMLNRINSSPQDMVHEITSPGGTSIAGLMAMKDFGFDRSVFRAFLKAALRSREIMKSQK